MYRSASTNRVSDDYFNYNSSSSSTSEKVSPALRALSLEANELPLYEPLSEMAKKERSRIIHAENAVHIIPFVLALCAFTLWFFSNPDINVPIKGDSVAAKIEGLTLEGELIDSDGTQLGLLTGVEILGDLDSSKKDEDHKASSLGMKFS
uniref:Transmembrane protein n=1 Tax=Davidia involucrata TaxID=16924 RepID=A0A5B7BQS4_DAVIN